jgi:dTDP-glucose pyrophosphorylase
MKGWEDVLVGPETPLREALSKIDLSGSQMALVVDDDGRLLGTLSDGDVRRALLGGGDMSTPAGEAMHLHPTTILETHGRDEGLKLMRRLALHQLPVVDAEGRAVGLEVLDDFFLPTNKDNWVVVMAGGVGSRLKELTRDTPKPMLEVGDRPILETIVSNFVDSGFRRFYFAVNYLSHVIEDHFGDGSRFGVEIRYVHEETRMGTAGALGLLPAVPDEPFFVINGDLLAQSDFGRMLEGHLDRGASATMAVRDYEFQIPFGVVRELEGEVARIEEKPVTRTLVNAGMYVISPEALEMVPPGERFDMPDLLAMMLESGMRVCSHRISGYWMDVGRRADLDRARSDYGQIFGD